MLSMATQVHRIQISIHALREEGDAMAPRAALKRRYFYPRPPRGGRHGAKSPCKTLFQFLSTPSARRATQSFSAAVLPGRISIHALREEGDRCGRRGLLPRPEISIHALREEGDDCQVVGSLLHVDFYPRPPRGGRRGRSPTTHTPPRISIHALREEGDGTQ